MTLTRSLRKSITSSKLLQSFNPFAVHDDSGDEDENFLRPVSLRAIGEEEMGDNPEEQENMQTKLGKARARHKVLSVFADSLDLHRVHEHELRMYVLQKWITGMAMTGLLIGIMVNESCLRGYIPTEEEKLLGWKDPLDEFPLNAKCEGVLVLKLLCSLSTALLLLLMCFNFRSSLIVLRHRQALVDRRHDLMMRSMGEASSQFAKHRSNGKGQGMVWAAFLWEICICSVHPVVGVSTDLGIESLGRILVYRIETIACIIMFFRAYHLFRLLRTWLYHKYLGREERQPFLMRNERTMKLLQDPFLNKGWLAFKIALAAHPLTILSGISLTLLIYIAYLNRAFDGTASLDQTYLYSSIWFIFATMTSCGYAGVMPITHFGRVTACFAILAGFVVINLTTAAIASRLDLNGKELSLMREMQHDRIRNDVLEATARIVQFLFRIKRAGTVTLVRKTFFGSEKVRISTKKQVERHRVELLKGLFGAVARYRHYTAQYRAGGDHQPLHTPQPHGAHGGGVRSGQPEGGELGGGGAKELGEMEDALWSTQTVIGSIEHVVSRMQGEQSQLSEVLDRLEHQHQQRAASSRAALEAILAQLQPPPPLANTTDSQTPIYSSSARHLGTTLRSNGTPRSRVRRELAQQREGARAGGLPVGSERSRERGRDKERERTQSRSPQRGRTPPSSLSARREAGASAGVGGGRPGRERSPGVRGAAVGVGVGPVTSRGGGEIMDEIRMERSGSMKGAMDKAAREAGTVRPRRDRERPSPREPTPRTASDAVVARRQLAALREAG